jgi:hypothetical protein
MWLNHTPTPYFSENGALYCFFQDPLGYRFLLEKGVNLHGHHPHLTLWHCMFGYPSIFVSIIGMGLRTIEGCQIILPIDDLSLILRAELFLFQL